MSNVPRPLMRNRPGVFANQRRTAKYAHLGALSIECAPSTTTFDVCGGWSGVDEVGQREEYFSSTQSFTTHVSNSPKLGSQDDSLSLQTPCTSPFHTPSPSPSPVFEQEAREKVPKHCTIRIHLRFKLKLKNDVSTASTENSQLPVVLRTYDKQELPHSAVKSHIFRRGEQYFVTQYFRCSTGIFKAAPPCRHCVKRAFGDTCRFIGLRVFPVENNDTGGFCLSKAALSQYDILRIEPSGECSAEPDYPSHSDLNRPLDSAVKAILQRTSARILLPVLLRAMEHAVMRNTFYRPHDLQIRATCDLCNTGLFASSFLCKKCGQEYCLACYANMLRDADDDALRSESYLFRCAKKGIIHLPKDMVPATRFAYKELEEEARHMCLAAEPRQDFDGRSTKQRHIETCTHPTNTLPSRCLASHCASVLSEKLFLATWQHGEPVMIEGVYTPTQWSPEEMQKRYGDVECDIVRCDDVTTDVEQASSRSTAVSVQVKADVSVKRVRVRDFFATFGMKPNERAETIGKGTWKLKDWPPSSEFKESCPDIYNEFNTAVPMPDYTRRDGCLNLSSFYPKNAVVPDLGPKMYNAWPAEHGKGKKGTTRLHMDMADAVNVLLYASEVSDPIDGMRGALWHIFRADDASAIRSFLRETCAAPHTSDPIHSQQYYLDDDLLQQLYDQKGVYAWSVVQQPGQAIFIPAGCAHQVCNLSDCIKIAVDFLSPHNVDRCVALTNEFRSISGDFRKSWKEDALQLFAQLWHTWKACRQLAKDSQPDESNGTNESDQGRASGRKRRRSSDQSAQRSMSPFFEALSSPISERDSSSPSFSSLWTSRSDQGDDNPLPPGTSEP